MAKTLFLGVEGSGKTTLAMALTRAFARQEAAGWYLRPVDRGAYNFATIAPEDFARDGFPRQTANVREMSWRIEKDGTDQGALEILDYPGEVYRLAFLDADDEPDPVAFRERAQAHAQEIARLRTALGAATRVFVLFNLQDALDLRGSDANRGAVWVTNESLKAAKALPGKPQVTLVFTQVDRYQTADDFLHRFTPRDLDLVGHDHPDVDWTMVSVVVPPGDEFGIDAFVRRCTGLASFGVPTGRPVDPAAARRGDALRGLAAAGGVAAPARDGNAAPCPPARDGNAAPCTVGAARRADRDPASGSAGGGLRPLLWGAGILLAALAAVGVGEALHVRARREKLLAEQARLEQEVARAEAERARKAAELKAAMQREAEAEKRAAAELQAARRKAEAERKAAAERAEAERKAAAERAEAERKAEAARQAKERAAREQAEKRFAEALAAASPQDAHAALCDAAESGLPAAQERLARVYDIWGWGGWVRTKEEAGARWTEWLRRIDLPKEGKAVPVSRPPENAEEFRKLARDWYRAAAENGVAAAAEALRLHGGEPPAPETGNAK